jgi:hypothetical protein
VPIAASLPITSHHSTVHFPFELSVFIGGKRVSRAFDAEMLGAFAINGRLKHNVDGSLAQVTYCAEQLDITLSVLAIVYKRLDMIVAMLHSGTDYAETFITAADTPIKNSEFYPRRNGAVCRVPDPL